MVLKKVEFIIDLLRLLLLLFRQVFIALPREKTLLD